MADYISTLTGIQMDSALIDMAEHTSEAYAIGERNGVPVGSDDVAYHNNARYYAQQAQSIAPASVTEAVRWDVAQTALTDAQREQARNNIAAADTNPNLLDNSWWGSGELVNSRGVTSGTIPAYVYAIDRWKFNYNTTAGTYSVGTNGITFVTPSGALTRISQIVNNIDALNGKVITASVLLSDGTITSGTITRINGTQQGISTLARFLTDNRFEITPNGNTTITIRAVKLELGAVSTLAYDVAPSYGESLTRCIYSKADPTDTYANNGFGRSNRNLLDNSWFQINQTSNTTGIFDADTRIVDRWFTTYYTNTGCSWSVSLNGISLTIGSSGDVVIKQAYNVNMQYLNGKTLTLSLLLTDGSLYKWTFVRTRNTNQFGTLLGGAFEGSIKTTDEVWIRCFSGANGKTIRAIKLEEGTVSTLANDVPPPYNEELQKCRYFFRRIANNAGSAQWCLTGLCATTSVGIFILDNPMRNATKIVSYSGSLSVNGSNVTTIQSYTRLHDTTINIATAGGLTQYGGAGLIIGASGYLDISADIS